MDLIYAEMDQANPGHLWLTPQKGTVASDPSTFACSERSVPLTVPQRSERRGPDEWANALQEARSELGLQAGAAISVVVSDPTLHGYPWELLGGPACDLNVVRQLPEFDMAGMRKPPSPLRVLLALPESLSALLRQILDGLHREGSVGLTMADADRIGAYLGQPGYYPVAHIPAAASCLSSARVLRRQCGRGKTALLVVHGRDESTGLAVLLEGQVPAMLILGDRLSEVQVAGFLQAFYKALVAGTPLVKSVVAGRAALEPGERWKPILLLARPEGDIWPANQRSKPARTAEPPDRQDRSQLPSGEGATGLFVTGDVNVEGDLVQGSQTKTVHHAEGDMVVSNRGKGPLPDKIVQTAGRDMVAINRSTGASDQKSEQQPAFCPFCEGEVEAGHAFCQNCGEALQSR